MKLKNAFVARVLAAAMVITSVLPMGTLTASAAPTVKTAHDQQMWMYSDADGNFFMDRSSWIDTKTGEPGDFGNNLTVGDAMASWHFSAISSDGSGHGDLTDSNAATTIYASGIDISSTGIRRVMQFDFVKLSASNSQFGIMLKYVDATHWVYLGNNGGAWYVEWRNGESGSYQNAGSSWNPAFASVNMEQGKYLRVRMVYENAEQIRVSVRELEEDRDADGNKTLVEKPESADLESILEFQAFKDVKDYAIADPENIKPIYFGFIGDYRSDRPASVNFMNVKCGAYTEKAITSEDPDVWAEDEELGELAFNRCGWNSPKRDQDPENNNMDDIIVEQNLGKGSSYVAIGDLKVEEEKAPDMTFYNNTVTDFSEGTIAADLRPHDVGANKECYLGVIDSTVTAQVPTAQIPTGKHRSFQVGIQNGTWVYSLDGEVEEIKKEGLPTFENYEEQDYTVSITIDKDKDVTATVKPDNGAAVKLIEKSDNVNVEGLSGSVSVATKNEVLYFKHVTCDQITYDKTPLEEKYEEIVKKKKEFYTDVWSAATLQGPLTEAKSLLDSDEYKTKIFDITPQSADNEEWIEYNSLFGQPAAVTLQGAFDAINVDANKVADGKGRLQAAFDKVITPGDPNAAEWYEPTSLETYAGIWNAVKTYLEVTLDLEDENFVAVSKAEVEAKIAEIEEAEANLEAKKATDADKTKLADAISSATPTDITDMDDTANTDYYNNWNAFKTAYDDANALKDKQNLTKREVDEAIAKLETETAKRTPKTVTSTSVTGYKNQVNSLIAGVFDEEDYKSGYNAYVIAKTAAEAIAAGDTVKSVVDKIDALDKAVKALVEMTLADDATIATTVQSEVDAIKTEVSGKKYVKDTNWTAYETALQAVEDLLAEPTSTKAAVKAALAALKDAKAKLTEDTSNTPKPPVVPPAKPALTVGQTATVSNNQYIVVDANAKTVALTKSQLDKKKTKKLTVPATVSVNGVNCTVVSIGKNTFKGYNKLTNVVIPESVTKIEGNAFSGCKKLKTVQIKNANINIAKNAFKGAPSKATVKVPKALKKNAKAKKKFQNMLKKAGLKNAKIK